MRVQINKKADAMPNEDDIYDEKRRFVQDELTNMLRAATNDFVRNLEYIRIGAVEHVSICIALKQCDFEVFDVDVTADSHWAIAKDVMKAVAKRFE